MRYHGASFGLDDVAGMGPLAPDSDGLRERLGELPVGLRLDARNTAYGYNPGPLLCGFGGRIAAMTHVDHARTPYSAHSTLTQIHAALTK